MAASWGTGVWAANVWRVGTWAGFGIPPDITVSTLPGGQVGAPYSELIARTGDEPMTWDITSGSLPSGLTLGASTGLISGIPLADGVSTPTIRATNAVSSDSQVISITINVVPVGSGGAGRTTMGMGMGMS